MADANIVGQQLARYLTSAWQQDVALLSAQQIPGGASRETFRVQLQIDGEPTGVVLRRDPPSSLIDTERAHEFRTYAAVYPTAIPVPEPLLLVDDDPGELERPFSLSREIQGCETAVAALAQPPYDGLKQEIGSAKWTLLGQLAALDINELELGFMARPEHPAKHELEYWANVIRSDALHPQPVAEMAIRWLEQRLPAPPDKLCLVHGDYRSGNFLFNRDGQIKGVLDWEMAHLGDPLEDLAWSMDPLWGFGDKQLAGSLLPRAEALAIWQSAFGAEADREALKWWQVFASVKALGIWVSSAEDFVNGTTKEPILAFAGWPLIDRQNRILLDRLDPASQNLYAEPLL